ncbi:MAG: TolC family protein [Candidatus Omnitrophica bacterium]|nr:TolC family protein [Candidatus Omnitrophota bacterium]
MKILRIFLTGLLLAIPSAGRAQASAPDAAGPALSLMECYALALKRSETVALQQEFIEETAARFTTVLGSVLPHVSFHSSDKRQDGAGQSAFTLRHVPERKFTLTQPLFTGFRELAALKGAKVLGRQREYEKERAEHLLLLDVANAYYLLLEQQEDLLALEGIHAAIVERLKELQDREQLGRSRSSEVVSTDARRLRIAADMETVRSRVVVTRQLLEFLTGQAGLRIQPDPETSFAPLEPLESYLVRTSQRPDVRAVEESVEVSRMEKAVVRSDFFPNVDLEGNYYTERVGVSKDVSWDVTLKVEVPIFEGTETVGAMRQASSRIRQSELRLSEARRKATLEIRDAYAQYEAGMARSNALGRALNAADENYRFQMEDYRRNLVNNLDVLQSLEELEGIRRDQVNALHETKRLCWQLKIAAGETK